MKQFNIGDKVKSKHSARLQIYVGINEDNPNWHVVHQPNTLSWEFLNDDEITLVASAEYIPVAKFHKGEFASWIDNVVSTVMILEDRNDKMQYKCYHPQMDIVYILESELRPVGDNA